MTDWDCTDAEMPLVRRKRSAWNVLLLLFGIQSSGFAWWGLFQLVALAQAALAPQKRFGQNLSNLGEIFMVIPLLFPALSIGMMAANLRTWLIPPARAALEQEAAAGLSAEFAVSMRQLALATAILLALGLALSLLGAVDFFQ